MSARVGELATIRPTTHDDAASSPLKKSRGRQDVGIEAEIEAEIEARGGGNFQASG